MTGFNTMIDLRDHIAPASLDYLLPKVSVVIATMNAAANLRHVLPLIPSAVHEVIIVDSGRTDGIAEMARSLCPRARVLLEPRPGKGAALRRGAVEATGDFIVALDADGSADPREIPAFVGALQAGADMAKGTRFRQGGGTNAMERHRRLGNRCLRTLVNMLYGGSYSDLCYGYFAIRGDVVESLFGDEGQAEGFEIETYLSIRALRLDLEIREVPSFGYRRIHGASSVHAVRDGFRILRVIAQQLVATRPVDTRAESAKRSPKTSTLSFASQKKS